MLVGIVDAAKGCQEERPGDIYALPACHNSARTKECQAFGSRAVILLSRKNRQVIKRSFGPGLQN